jgi:arginyl-tRNA--protein-N-Asp/Glu arginylyltransferase
VVRESQDDLSEMYASGYLPHSADPKQKDLFYMARSARVPLEEFSFTSENRRIAKRFDDTLTTKKIRAGEIPAEVLELFLDYFAKRHGKNVMPRERLERILSSDLPLVFTVYENETVPLAAVLEVSGKEFRHFWFSAYDLALTEQSLGMWLMLDCARRAKEEGVRHYYVGTVYGPKALYKANLEPLLWWDGTKWSDDIKKLKALARAEQK